jgi:hypothetical protein
MDDIEHRPDHPALAFGMRREPDADSVEGLAQIRGRRLLQLRERTPELGVVPPKQNLHVGHEAVAQTMSMPSRSAVVEHTPVEDFE